MGEYPKALSYYEKALGIRQTTLPLNHPDVAASYNNIGLVYSNMGNYPKALSYLEHAADILQLSLSPNYLHIQSVGASIKFVKEDMKNNVVFLMVRK